MQVKIFSLTLNKEPVQHPSWISAISYEIKKNSDTLNNMKMNPKNIQQQNTLSVEEIATMDPLLVDLLFMELS